MSDTDLIRMIQESEEWAGRPFTSANELAERVDMTRQGVRQRLEQLVDNGEIKRHKPSRDVIYWRD
jgi:DNA-binding Lrp family transcriptional regulator